MIFFINYWFQNSFHAETETSLLKIMESDFQTLRKVLTNPQIDIEGWCRKLSAEEKRNYILKDENKKILCGDLILNIEDQNLLKNISSPQDQVQISTLLDSESGMNRYFFSTQLGDLNLTKQTSLLSNVNRYPFFNRLIFFKVLVTGLTAYFLILLTFYYLTKPLGIILSKTNKFKKEIPFHKKLKLLNRKDEWKNIEEALNKLDLNLQNQLLEIESENEKNTAILESINNDIIAIDSYETILFYNSKFAQDFKIQPDSHSIDKKIWHIFDEEVLGKFKEVLTIGTPQALKAKKFKESYFPDKIYDLSITPLKNRKGVVRGALGVLFDVTEFKRTEQMRVDFVANVSHEIRTPLTSIKGYSQILHSQSEKIDDSLHPFLERIISNTERMISLFNDLLSLSVIESKNELNVDDINISEKMKEVEDNLKTNYPDRRIIFVSHYEIEQMKGDPRLIEQVFLNLCDNACKYGSNEIIIEVTTKVASDHFKIIFKDNGPGISKEHLSRIFERFYRVDASREGLRGTGLGLSIVKQIVSKHKGKIHAESNQSGTSFIIELPFL